MTWQDFVAVAGGLGVGSILTTVIPLLWRSLTGREARRKDDAERAWGVVRDLRNEIAGLHGDVRRTKEHASLLRRMLLEADCIKPEEIPPWPNRPSKE